MNVLLIHNRYKYSGGEDVVFKHEKDLLVANGHDVVEYIRNNSDIDNLSIFTKMLIPFQFIYSKKVYKELIAIIEKKKIDIVHCHNIVPLIGFSTYLAASKNNIPVVQSLHNYRYLCPGGTFVRNGNICRVCIKSGLNNALKYGCYRNSKIQTFFLVIALKIHRKKGTFQKIKAYLVPTEFNKSLFKGFIPENKIYVKPYSVESKRLQCVKQDYYVYVARIERMKGIYVAVEAFIKSGKRLLVLGIGDDEEQVRELVKEHKADNIEFVGQKSYEEMQKLIAGAKALIFPTQWYEGLPMTIVESFAQGTPVIGSNMGNVGNEIVDGYNGFKFSYQSADALNEAIQRLENASSDNLAYNCIKTYEEKYSTESDYNRLINIYQKVCG